MSSSRRKKAETSAGFSATPSPSSPGGSGSKGRTRRAVATPPPETEKEKEEEAATPPLVEKQSRASTPPTVNEEQPSDTTAPAGVARALSFDGELQVVVSQRERRLRGARMRLEALLDKYDADVKSGSFITDRETECAKQLREIDDDLRLALQPTLCLPTEEQSSGIYVLGTVGQLRFLDLLPGEERRGLFGTAYKGKVGASGTALPRCCGCMLPMRPTRTALRCCPARRTRPSSERAVRRTRRRWRSASTSIAISSLLPMCSRRAERCVSKAPPPIMCCCLPP